MKFQQETMDVVVSREIGRKWGQCYLITSIIYLLQLTLVYSCYALDIFYQISSFIFQKTFSLSSTNRDDINVFTNYSILYSTLLISPLIIVLIMRRSSQNILKLKSWTYFLSSISIFAYLCYILYIFFNQSPINTTDFQLNQISFHSIANFIANNNLAYENQLYLHKILTVSNGRVTRTSLNSVKYSIVIVFLIYALVGILGSFAIDNLSPINPSFDNFVFDYFDENAFTVIIKCFMIYHFLQNLTYRYIVLRDNLLKFLLNSKKIQNMQEQKERMKSTLNTIFAAFYIIVNFIDSNLQYKFTIITGSIAGFFIIYLVPYKLRFGRLKQTKKILNKNFNIQDSSLSHSIVQAQEEDSKLIEDDKQFLLSFSQNSRDIERKLMKQVKKHKVKFYDKLILLFGFVISVYGILYFVTFIINN